MMLEKQLLLGLAVLVASSCHVQRKVTLPGSSFRLTAIEGRAVLIPPPLIYFPADKPLTVDFQIAPSKQAGCEFSNDLFTVKATGGHVSLTMPSLNDWTKLLPYWETPSDKNVDRKLSAVFNSLESLESRGCLTNGSALTLRQLLRDSIPLRPGFGLYSAYGYGPGSIGLDLKPSTRLKIQRAHFVDERRTVDAYLGLTAVYFKPVENKRGQITFEQMSTDVSKEELRPLMRLDLQLRNAAKPELAYRLLFLTTYVAKGVKRSALILGTSTANQMTSMEQTIIATPTMSCADLIAKTGKTSCVSFDGEVSVSAEIAVNLNGVATYVDFGASVRTTLASRKIDASTADLRVQRNFQGRLLPIIVDPNVQKDLLDLVLVGGDQLYTKK